MEGRLARALSVVAFLPLAVALVAGAIVAVGRWNSGEPEWSYYRTLARLPLAESTGPDEKLFGYLPGARALIAPFVWTEPVGFFAFLAASVASCVGAAFVLRRARPVRSVAARPGEISASASPLERLLHDRLLADLWLSCCLCAPIYFALHNNQLVSFGFALALAALARAGRLGGAASGAHDASPEARADLAVGALLAIGALFKTLPILLAGFLFLSGRRRAAFATAGILAALGFSLAAFTDGPRASLDAHLAWIPMVTQQDPTRVLEGDVPWSFDVNQSALAYAVRLAVALDSDLPVRGARAAGTLAVAVLALATFRARRDRSRDLAFVAAWMAWIAFAAPFGRYYYLLFCVPTWILAGPPSRASGPHWRLPFWGAPFLAFTAGAGNPTYAIYTGLTLALALWIALAPASFLARLARAPSRREVARMAVGAGIACLAVAAITPGAILRAGSSETASEAAMERLVEDRRATREADVFYVDDDFDAPIPAFGRAATRIDDEDEVAIEGELRDRDEDFFILQYEAVPEFLEKYGTENFEFFGRRGGYFLYRERSPGSSSAGAGASPILRT